MVFDTFALSAFAEAFSSPFTEGRVGALSHSVMTVSTIEAMALFGSVQQLTSVGPARGCPFSRA